MNELIGNQSIVLWVAGGVYKLSSREGMIIAEGL